MDPNSQPNYQSQPAEPASQVTPQASPSVVSRKLVPNRYLLTTLGIAALLTGYYFLSNRAGQFNPEVLAQQPGGGEVEVVNTSSKKIVPEGFPAFIPVETQNIEQAFKIEYREIGVTQYTVSFQTSTNKEDVWGTYSDTLRANGFILATTSDQTIGVLQGGKLNDELNVSINEFGSTYLVTINYIERE